jgi:hypothetical protein
MESGLKHLWLAMILQEGDEVSEFQPICEVQSDKASIEITSRYSGTIARVHNKVGDLIKVSNLLIARVVPCLDLTSSRRLMRVCGGYKRQPVAAHIWAVVSVITISCLS